MANEYAGQKELRETAIYTIFVSATTPADAAFSSTPPNGTMVFNTADSKLYIRIGGSWIKSAAFS